ncbi:MAG: hypothetical protein IJH04_09245 [Eggerthellaceae bacterium]|nr:hypothetical protein [Eggerthellaceae bacterium]
MAVIRGCEEGKYTPKPESIKCPECGEEIEVFVRMGGQVGQAGTLAADETCEKCGYVVKADTNISEYEKL